MRFLQSGIDRGQVSALDVIYRFRCAFDVMTVGGNTIKYRVSYSCRHAQGTRRRAVQMCSWQ